MSAADALHPFQMRLFMQANELMDLPAGDSKPLPSGGPNQSLRQDINLQNRKREENTLPPPRWKAPRLADPHLGEDVKAQGVIQPVSLYYRPEYGHTAPQIDDGHHRVVAAYDANPESWVPVRYH